MNVRKQGIFKVLRRVLIIIVVLLVSCRTQKQTVEAVVKPAKPTVNAPTKKPVNWHDKIGISTAQAAKHKLYRFIDDWYGIPYQYGGCLKSGVDCSCFVTILNKEVYGKKLARTADEMFKNSKLIKLEDAREGDLFFFKINAKTITHVGVCVKGTWFVHASVSKGVIVNSLDEAYYKKYFYCAGRNES